jgi:2-dehydro-3-deoxy-D-arabinonate dehydratase
MKLYRTTTGIIVESEDGFHRARNLDWDSLISGDDPAALIKAAIDGSVSTLDGLEVLAPVVSQEVWAAGVTYYRSRDARIEESQGSGAHTFYDHVYRSERPELFFKATGRRVVGPHSGVRIRSDAKWSVPEPELTLVINSAGSIIGDTVGNDMSARDIEGENPLFLPQAKIYDGSCALGPCILLCSKPLPNVTKIAMTIERGEECIFSESTTLAELKRSPTKLVEALFQDNSFPQGVFLMTGTGIVPSEGFTLQHRDKISIQIDEVGILKNYVK